MTCESSQQIKTEINNRIARYNNIIALATSSYVEMFYEGRIDELEDFAFYLGVDLTDQTATTGGAK